MIRLLISFLFFSFSSLLLGQNSAGFFIEKGNLVPFVFNSFSKLENGVTYTDWTRIKIKMQETTVDAIDTFILGWTLNFRAITPAINGDAGGSLPLNTLRLRSVDNSPNPPQFTPTGGYVALNSGYQALATTIPGFHVPNTIAAGPEQTILDISYECGGNNSGCPLPPCNRLLGQTPDLYTVDIELLLTVPQVLLFISYWL